MEPLHLLRFIVLLLFFQPQVRIAAAPLYYLVILHSGLQWSNSHSWKVLLTLDAHAHFHMVFLFRCGVSAGIWFRNDSGSKEERFIMFQHLCALSSHCFRTLNVILIHERLTLFYVFVDPSVVSGGLSVRPVLRSLWMERSLSIFSESQSSGNLCVQIKPIAWLCG